MGILEFEGSLLEELHALQTKTKRKTVLFSISYENGYISPINLHSNSFFHILKLLMKWRNTIKIKQMTVDTGKGNL
jgi:hypothetical protein